MAEKKKRTRWTIPMIQAEALKYDYRKDFENNSPAYHAARRAGVLDQVCSHMKRLRNDGVVLTVESFVEMAREYSSPNDMQTRNPSLYGIAHNRGVFAEARIILRNEGVWNTYVEWDDESVAKKALEYEYRTDFAKNAPGAYNYAIHNGILDEVCKHMKIKGNFQLRKVYVYEFPEKHCYVGLTCDIKRRASEHRKIEKSAVHQYLEKTGVSYVLKELSDWLDKDKAGELEEQTRLRYKEEGWTVLNKIKGGGLGGYVKFISFTMEEMQQTIAGCKSKIEFHDKHYSMYRFARKNGMWEELSKDLPEKYQPIVKWTDEAIDEAVKGYSKPSELPNNVRLVLEKRHLMDKYFPNRRKPRWSIENLEKAVAECPKPTDLLAKYPGAYRKLYRNGLLDKYYPNRHPAKKPPKPKKIRLPKTWGDIEAAINASQNLKQMRTEHYAEYKAARKNPEWRRELYRRLPSRKHKSNM